ncbi:MAG TPA: hypothetical protein VGM64_15375 [Lacunisphaera sp.]
MRIILGILLSLVAGYSSPRVVAPLNARLVGTYCLSSIDAATCITLEADHHYLENFYSSAAGIPSEARGGGKWRQRNNEILLYPDHGSPRVLKITDGNGGLELSEKYRSGMVRTYRRNDPRFRK